MSPWWEVEQPLIFLSRSASMLMLVLAYFLRIYKRRNALLIGGEKKSNQKYLQVYVRNKKKSVYLRSELFKGEIVLSVLLSYTGSTCAFLCSLFFTTPHHKDLTQEGVCCPSPVKIELYSATVKTFVFVFDTCGCADHAFIGSCKIYCL